jgi:kynurenine formamidase
MPNKVLRVHCQRRTLPGEIMEAAMCVPGCQEMVHRALSRRRMLRAAASFAAIAVAPSPALAAPRPFKKVIDLTHTMSADFPTFDGTPGIEMQKVFDLKKDGYNLYRWSLIEHSGTHLDAPIHFSDGGIAVEQIPAAALMVPLAVIGVADKAAKDPDYQLSRADLAAWERRHGRLPDNACVAMNSGWAKHVADKAKYIGKDAGGVMHFPGIAPDAAAWLLKDRKVAGLAVDTLSLDHGASKDFKTHVSWLGAGRWGLENVAALDNVPASGATLIVGLAKVKGATGGPTRLFALV